MTKRLFQEEMALLEDSDTFVLKGRVERVVGLTAELADFSAPVGAVCRIETAEGEAVEGEVVGFKSNKAVMMPYGNTQGFKAGDWVREIAPIVGGGGGGKPQMAHAGGKQPDKLPEALVAAGEWIKDKLGGRTGKRQ